MTRCAAAISILRSPAMSRSAMARGSSDSFCTSPRSPPVQLTTVTWAPEAA